MRLRKLPLARKKDLIALERALVAIFADAIAAAIPSIGEQSTLLKPVTMSLFGMLNWHYMWFREKGPVSREDYADMVTTLLIEGAQALGDTRNVEKALGLDRASDRVVIDGDFFRQRMRLAGQHDSRPAFPTARANNWCPSALRRTRASPGRCSTCRRGRRTAIRGRRAARRR